jgi:site-specific DNA-methyltransferase (adenine-specific)
MPKKYSFYNMYHPTSIKILVIKPKRERGLHPTQKPVALLEYLIKTYTNENDTVLDFTMGSGSTGVACKNLNRNFIGIEKDDKYFDIAKQRIFDLSKQRIEGGGF